VGGVCDCPNGYTGDSCQTAIQALITGNYSVTDACSITGSSSYNVVVSNGATVDQVLVLNFWDVFINTVVVQLGGDSTLTLPNQEPDGDNFWVQGSGSWDGNNTIEWTYSITDSTSSNTDACSGTWVK
jgi:hypothetical protein